ncbi:MAG: CoA ester lyase [Phenylobacterium sp.]|uniref:HpcH/HpaI aldolase/citrate lyase family protein n=1 Tax=Phenylobacterium sp. TaxID=1871053 RepID=UPI00273304FD|nr:CoA ester lyase [Phenylobacterium sp.]MDP3746543.1 CoA ester lyase [Phenylobacterium sp.]
MFAPASRPDRFARALAAGADAVCLDLEDAVPPDAKGQARAAVRDFLNAPRRGGPAVGVRINALGTPWWSADVEIGAQADFVMVPKTGHVDDLELVSKAAPDTALWPLIETPEGVMRCWEIAAAPKVQGVLFGAFDYAAEVGCAREWEPLLFVRSLLAAACARVHVELLDAPSGNLGDLSSLEPRSRRAKALGFTGRACIHPDQVAAVNVAYTPSAIEVQQAARVIAAFESAAGGAAQLDGKLIELPVALAARRVLARGGD